MKIYSSEIAFWYDRVVFNITSVNTINFPTLESAKNRDRISNQNNQSTFKSQDV
jgi:hypothetical protein